MLGPTGGYIAGYIPLVIITGLAVQFFPKNRTFQLLGMIAATAVLYALGTAWYIVQSGNPLDVAMKYCVIPFIPGDLIKMVIAMLAGPVLQERLIKANLNPKG